MRAYLFMIEGCNPGKQGMQLIMIVRCDDLFAGVLVFCEQVEDELLGRAEIMLEVSH